jgi:GTP-binding protein YchF
MEIGILGLAGSGKSTLFSLLTEQQRGAAASGRNGASVGVAQVPDQRLDRLSALFVPKKTTQAAVHYVDVPGLDVERRGGEELNIPELRPMDALMVVVRAFANPAVPHPLTAVDPARDLERIEQELALADLIVVERRLERLERDLSSPELEAERELLERCRVQLEAAQPLRDQSFAEGDLRRLRAFSLLSLKPLLVVVNIDETDVGTDPIGEDRWTPWRGRRAVAMTTVCATLESEMAELEAADLEPFMAELGIPDRALDRVVRESYRLLGFISFFTVGEDECRAWSIRAGSTAEEAAGAIHSDIRRGFIRAEVVSYEQLLAAGSLTSCRQRGQLRLEGRCYPVQDGEVVHFRFNV